jgi:ParB family chromosome partitioning protein
MANPPNLPEQYRTVQLSQIDLQNDEFHITTRDDVDDLLPSIRYAGLTTPPLLIEQTSGYTIVSGFRRVAACRKLGWNEVFARILGPEQNHLEYLHLSIADNALQRPLNLIETSRAFQKLASFVDSPKQLTEAALICGLPSNYSVISKVKDLCLLPQAIQNCILSDTISLTMANELARMETDIAVEFADVFEQLNLSLNKQKEMVTLVSEIAHRQDISIRQVLSQESLKSIINDEDLDRGQKGRQLRDFLRQWRFPRIVEAERYYNIQLKKLRLGQDIKLIPPKEFEGTAFTLIINFTSLAHLKISQSILDKVSRYPSFKKILAISKK